MRLENIYLVDTNKVKEHWQPVTIEDAVLYNKHIMELVNDTVFRCGAFMCWLSFTTGAAISEALARPLGRYKDHKLNSISEHTIPVC